MLCTLGSVYQAMPFRDGEEEWDKMRRYDYLIVDET